MVPIECDELPDVPLLRLGDFTAEPIPTKKSTFKYDGTDYSFAGSPDYDALALKRVNGSTISSTMKLGGKAVGTSVRSISDHGKKLTLTTNLKNAKGKKYHAVAVFDRQ